jgi:DNA mismatch repair protein MutL
MSHGPRIRQLDPIIAQRIAAGEVIDRPQAIVRELLDNAIDAGSTRIDVYIEDGGISSIKVIDDGTGMDREDLALCCRSHATSKISEVSDLYAIRTLGFRGEALASMAACSKMTIMSSPDREHTNTLTVTEGLIEEPVPGGYAKGTTIEVRDLFYSIPGRKNFLKSPQAEAAACKRVFIDKALAFPQIEFRFFSSGTLKLFLRKADALQRVIDAFPKKFDPVFFSSVHQQCGSFSLDLICSTTSLYRNDRSYIKVFVNDRRIDDYALMQAIGYGYADHLPGGCFPYCFAFITVDPELVDVNIHPAKREIKLRIAQEVHHQLVQTIKQHLYQESRSELRDSYTRQQAFTFSSESQQNHSPAVRTAYRPSSNQPAPSHREPVSDQWIKDAQAIFSPGSAPAREPEQDVPVRDFSYLGQLFGVFLLVERDQELYLIDQHAAHEKIIYHELSTHPTKQQLLVPLSFSVSEATDRYLSLHADEYAASAVVLRKDPQQELTWEIMALPYYAKSIESEIVSFIQQHLGSAEEITRGLFASISCRAAVKEGDVLDELTAAELIERAFALEVPRCPHGRPIWTIITREELFKAVQRII